jgi:hypothetical protein
MMTYIQGIGSLIFERGNSKGAPQLLLKGRKFPTGLIFNMDRKSSSCCTTEKRKADNGD